MYNYKDPLAPGHRKRLLGSGEKVETMSKRPKDDVITPGMVIIIIS